MLVLAFVIIAATCVIDQMTKWLAVTYLMPIGDYPLIEGVFHLTYAENTGMAFSMLQGQRWIFITFSIIAIVLMTGALIVYRKKLDPLLAISLALIIGGGVGNMIDRLALGYVVDFLNFELINFAIFNAADSFVCIGAGLMVIYMIIDEMRTSRKKKAEKESHEATSDERK